MIIWKKCKIRSWTFVLHFVFLFPLKAIYTVEHKLNLNVWQTKQQNKNLWQSCVWNHSAVIDTWLHFFIYLLFILVQDSVLIDINELKLSPNRCQIYNNLSISMKLYYDAKFENMNRDFYVLVIYDMLKKNFNHFIIIRVLWAWPILIFYINCKRLKAHSRYILKYISNFTINVLKKKKENNF